MKQNFNLISEYYILYRVKDPNENPLCLATSLCDRELIENGLSGRDPILNNDNQLIKLDQNFPFFKLLLKRLV